MGGRTISTEQQKIGSINLQTSTYGLPIPIVFGKTRITGNLIWYGNFKAIAHTTTKSQGGKGVGKIKQKETTYTYEAAVQMALCEGPISGVTAVWKGKEKSSLAELNLSVAVGTEGQAPWSFSTSYMGQPSSILYENLYGYAGQGVSFASVSALGYSGTAYVASSSYLLSDDASVPNHGFEVRGLFSNPAWQDDCLPSDVVVTVLTHPRIGSGFPSAMLGDLGSYTNYCRSLGLFVSPAYTTQTRCSEMMTELTKFTNTEIVWSEGILKFIPYGDVPSTGNGATYTPNLTPLFDLGVDDFLDEVDPVKIERKTPLDRHNRMQMEYLNRQNQYNVDVVFAEDQESIESIGLRTADPVSGHMFTRAEAARQSVQLMLQRQLFKPNEYKFSLNARYPMLEPMDIVTLTEPGLHLEQHPVRITEVEEMEDGFSITAEDLPIGVASAALYQHDNGIRYQALFNAIPSDVAAPYIFELPPDPTTTGLAIGVAVGGQPGDFLYGGCRVWVSTDNLTYKSLGTLYGSSRYGALTATLGDWADPNVVDGSNTLSLALASDGQILSGSNQDRDTYSTLMVVGGEFISYRDATLTGANAYNLTSLRRGVFRSDIAGDPQSHAAGTKIARVDNGIFQIPDMDLSLIGKTIWFKFTQFNTYGTVEEDLSAVTAYSYVVTGSAKQLQTPVDFDTEVGGPGKPESNATVGAPQNTSVGGIPVEIWYSLTPSGMLEDWNKHGTLAAAQRAWDFDNPGALALGTDGNMSGGWMLQVTGTCSLRGKHRIPYAYEDLYRLRARVYVSAVGSGNVQYLGITAFDASGTELTDTDYGTYHYFGGAHTPSVEGFYEWEGYFRGRAATGTGADVGRPAPDPSVPYPVEAGAVTVSPIFLANFGGTGGQVRIDYISIDKVEDLTPLPSRAWNATDFQKRGQVVSYLGRSWIARVDNTNVTPPSNNVGTATWGLLSDKGTDGTNGTNGTNGTDGTDGVDGVDGKLIEFVWRRSPTIPTTPTGNGIPAGWSDDPPAGSDPLWMSKAKQELDGTLVPGESWSVPIRHDGPPGADGTDGVDGNDGAPGADGAGTFPIYIRSATQPATPSPSSGVPAGWYSTTQGVPAGSSPMWVSIGTRPNTTSNWTWPAPVRHEAISAVGTGEWQYVTESPSPEMTFSLEPGQSRVVNARVFYPSPTGPGTVAVQIEYGEVGGSWTASTGTSFAFNTSEPAAASHTVTITNSTGVARPYRTRATSVVTGSPGVREAATSVVRV